MPFRRATPQDIELSQKSNRISQWRDLHQELEKGPVLWEEPDLNEVQFVLRRESLRNYFARLQIKVQFRKVSDTSIVITMVKR